MSQLRVSSDSYSELRDTLTNINILQGILKQCHKMSIVFHLFNLMFLRLL